MNKQGAQNPVYRSYLVGKEFTTWNETALYATTVALDVHGLLLSIAAASHTIKEYAEQ